MDSKSKKNMPKKWIGCEIEEDLIPHNPKEDKTNRKIASQKDRSKYKKTDHKKMQKIHQEEHLTKISKKELFKGRVLSIAPEGILVDSEEGLFLCTLRGLLKKEKQKAKNLVTVGDFVLFEKISNKEGTIAHVQERTSVLSRQDHLLRRKEQLIAANIDQVLITVSVLFPTLKPSLIDRYIIATLKGNMQPVIVINKIDLLESNTVEWQAFKDFISIYHSLEIPVVTTSVIMKHGLDELMEIMKGKASVFSGQSGVGKSSLINAITGLTLRTAKIVQKTGKGAHTTTTTQLIPLSFGGFCVDTPGIRSFGLWNVNIQDLENYFPEIKNESINCKYPNCTHIHEPGCNVQKAVEEGKISPLRLDSYQKLFLELEQEKQLLF